MDVPCQTYCPCTDVMLVGAEYGRTVHAVAEVEQVTVVVGIVTDGICTDRTGTAFIISRISIVRITVGIRWKRIVTYRETDGRVSMSLGIHLREVTTGCKVHQMYIVEKLTVSYGQFAFVLVALASTVSVAASFGKFCFSETAVQW